MWSTFASGVFLANDPQRSLVERDVTRLCDVTFTLVRIVRGMAFSRRYVVARTFDKKACAFPYDEAY